MGKFLDLELFGVYWSELFGEYLFLVGKVDFLEGEELVEYFVCFSGRNIFSGIFFVLPKDDSLVEGLKLSGLVGKLNYEFAGVYQDHFLRKVKSKDDFKRSAITSLPLQEDKIFKLKGGQVFSWKQKHLWFAKGEITTLENLQEYFTLAGINFLLLQDLLLLERIDRDSKVGIKEDQKADVPGLFLSNILQGSVPLSTPIDSGVLGTTFTNKGVELLLKHNYLQKIVEKVE